MDRLRFERLTALQRLDHKNILGPCCKVCEGDSRFFDVVDFNKICSDTEPYFYGASGIPVHYFQCYSCGFIFTNFFDDWTNDEFSAFVYNDDYIKVDGEYISVRPERTAIDIAKRLAGIQHLSILDYGSGSGVFANHLRTLGYESAVSYDPFSNPIRPTGQFDVVTCFEVLEHTVSPHEALADMVTFLNPAGCIVFGTGIQPQNIEELRANWWYIAPRNGHASIFTLRSLALLGQAAGLTLYTGAGLGLAGASPSSDSLRILETIGLSYRVIELRAPDESMGAQGAKWHGLERVGSNPFRWTADQEVVWNLGPDLLPAGTVEVRIPFDNEVQPGFADHCRLDIGGDSTSLIRQSGALRATLTLTNPTAATIRMITPVPLRPCDLRPAADSRTLGLAISIKPAKTRANNPA
jgi:2-polyprenyl-6-hydroxyphenyl methylase/3-demethylubiquinone-9 3-methyltransferase